MLANGLLQLTQVVEAILDWIEVIFETVLLPECWLLFIAITIPIIMFSVKLVRRLIHL